ncbi:hypothetical protein NL676_029376 [Syzygium grande]|nr:hypothetical protein NL676_029376 [Syzygium grande]
MLDRWFSALGDAGLRSPDLGLAESEVAGPGRRRMEGHRPWAKLDEGHWREGAMDEVVSPSLPSESRAKAPARILEDAGMRDRHGGQSPEWWWGAVR